MSQDDPYPATYPDGVEPRRLTPRGRMLSWIGGLLGLALLIGFAVWLSHRAASPGAQGGGAGGRGGGRQGGRGGGGGGGMFGGGGGMQTTTVGTAKATSGDLAVQVEALGTVTPAATVTVRPQVSGTITQLNYREGQLVRKGPVARGDRPAPVPGGAAPGEGRADPRPGAAGERTSPARPLRHPPQGGFDRAAGSRYPIGAGPPADRDDRGRSRPGAGRADQLGYTASSHRWRGGSG